MKVYECLKKGQEVWVLTNKGLKKGTYLQLSSPTEFYIGPIDGYSDEYGTVKSYDYFPADKVFTTREAAKDFLLYGKQERPAIVETHESKFEVGDKVYSFSEGGGIREMTVTSVKWRLGQWEYHTNYGGCAYYLERGAYFKTKEEAVEAYLNL